MLTKTALFTILALTALTQAAAAKCTGGTYWSKSFNECVHRPYDYVAVCKDGTSSVSAYVPGACRGHGGVDRVQKKAR